jgi:hypothetical protein
LFQDVSERLGLYQQKSGENKMTVNFPGPYELRVNYTVDTFDHVLKLNVKALANPTPGTPFSGIDIDDDVLGSVDLATATDELIDLLQPLFKSTDCTFTTAELWKNIPLTYQATYVSSYDINLAATGGAGTVTAGEVIYTFRTYEGGIMKVYLEEANRVMGGSRTYTQLTGDEQDLVDHIIAPNARYVGRDTSSPFAFLKLHPGQNEAIFKKRYRS